MDPSPYTAPQPLNDETETKKPPVGYRNLLLVAIWVTGMLGLPLTTIYETIQTQSTPDYRLGWIHLVAPAIACVTPAFFDAKWPQKLGMIVLTPIICIVMEVATVIVDVMFFNGLNGIQ